MFEMKEGNVTLFLYAAVDFKVVLTSGKTVNLLTLNLVCFFAADIINFSRTFVIVIVEDDFAINQKVSYAIKFNIVYVNSSLVITLSAE